MSSPTYFQIPIRTSKGGNNREHYMVRARRVKAERTAVAWAVVSTRPPPLPVVVTLVRHAPSNGLDDDNLTQALKPVRDQLAVWLKVDDRDPRVQWKYGQARAPWGVAVKVEQMQVVAA